MSQGQKRVEGLVTPTLMLMVFFLRSFFLNYFENSNHKIMPSASLIPIDETLLFTAAGMVPFKEYFIGNAIPVSLRVADTQKCLRVSGKHNDLEEVGYDSYHHTLLERT